MSRQNLGALIVSLVVVLSLVVAVFIVPAIQPRSLEARNALDEAADRAARRLNVTVRTADRAVADDREQLAVPAEVAKPSEEAIQRAVAKADLLQPTRELSDTFRNKILRQQDERYTQVAHGAPKVDEKLAGTLQPPAGEGGQVAWLKQTLAHKTDYAAKTLSEITSAINDLQKSMTDATSAGLNSSEHFRSNYVMAGLQTEKAMLLANLAANQRQQAARVRQQLIEQYGWYTDVSTQAEAIQSRLKGLTQTSSTPDGQPAAREPAAVVARYEQEVDQQIAASQQRIAQIQQSMVEPQQQLEQAKAQSQQLQQQLAQLEQAGYDVTNASSFETYKKTYADLSSQLRKAEMSVQSLQEGTMAGATIDPAGPDDLTKAKYVGGQPQVGLDVLGKRLAAERKVLADLESMKKDLQESHGSLVKYNQGMDNSLAQTQARAKEVLDQVNKTCEQLDGLVKTAADKEDQALASCKQALQAYNLALQAAKKDQGDAASALTAASPSPDKPNRRLEMLRDYNSPEAGSERGLVSVYMLIARIDMQRASDLQLHVAALNLASSIGAQPADVQGTEKALQESLDGAMTALAAPDSNANALYHAEKLGTLIQREKFAWLGHATRGLVYNMLAQVQAMAGRPQAADSRGKAIEAFGEALKGNENSELLQPYAMLLASLKQGS